MGSQRVDSQDALIREAPLAAGNEDGEQLTVCRDVAAGIIVDLTVWHQNVDGGWTGDKKRRHISLKLKLNILACGSLRYVVVNGCTVSNYVIFDFSIKQKVESKEETRGNRGEE